MKSVTRIGNVIGLALSLLVLPAPAAAEADPCAGGGCLGPKTPALIDTNENGRPDPGVDLAIGLTLGPAGLIVNSPWHRDALDTDNVISFRESDLKRSGKFMSFQRSSRHGLRQRLDVDEEGIVSGRPTRFLFTESRNGVPGVTGWAELRDVDGDGLHERLAAARVSTSTFGFELGFVGADVDGDGHADYISIPWAQASLLGVAFGDGNGPVFTAVEDPQVWLPLVDTDGDGAPDSIVLDLDGDSRADSKLFWTPRLATRAVHSLPLDPRWRSHSRASSSVSMGVGLAVLGVCAGGWAQLRRRRVLG